MGLKTILYLLCACLLFVLGIAVFVAVLLDLTKKMLYRKRYLKPENLFYIEKWYSTLFYSKDRVELRNRFPYHF